MDAEQVVETMAPDRAADASPEVVTEAVATGGEVAAVAETATEVGDDQQQQSNAEHGTAQGRPDGAETSEGADDSAAAADTPSGDDAPVVAETVDRVTPEALAQLRDQFVALNPAVVPELITGSTIAEVLSSLDAARAAYARVETEVMGRVAGAVPRGGGSRTLDPAVVEGLSPEAKIAYGLRQQA